MTSAPIVVGTDGSPTAQLAVARAAEVAAALESTVHIVTCYDRVPVAAAAGSFGMVVPVDDQALERAREVAAGAREIATASGAAVDAHVCEGQPADVLITLAAELGAQMIVVGNRGMSGARRVLGSVPNRVSHQARCDVLIVMTG
jgi:nucleotide-binding universal stress UspA family protein